MTWVKACRSDDLALGACRPFEFDEGYLVLSRLEDGVFAMDNICPHREAELHDGDIENGHIYCPLHGWRFNLRTGTSDAGEQFDLMFYPTKEEDEHIWVNTGEGRIWDREGSLDV